MKILITGGSGFIGSHLVKKLLTLGHKLVVLDDMSTGKKENIGGLQGSNLELQLGSVLDYQKCEKLIKESDYVFHLAAAVGVFNIVQKPLDSMITNIKGTEIVLELANKYHKQILLTSSSEIYGKNSIGKLSEDSDRVLGPTNLLRWSYAES